MGLLKKCWSFVAGKSESKGFDFSDEHRSMSLETRRLNSEKKRLKHRIEMARMKSELQDLESELEEYEDEGDCGDDGIAGDSRDEFWERLLAGVFLGNSGGLSGKIPTPHASSVEGGETISIEKIVSVLRGKGLSESQIDLAIKELRL